MKNDLRAALKTSVGSSAGILYAYFASKRREYVDIENALFYNIGAGSYRHLSENGIVFGVTRKVPPAESANNHLFDYYQCYYLKKPSAFLPDLCKGEVIAEWYDVASPPLKSMPKPHSFWHLMKKGQTKQIKILTGSSPIGICVKVHPPYGSKANLPATMKTMLDGIFCAFHSHNGANLEHVSTTLGDYLDISSEEAQSQLMDAEMNVLGTRALVGPFLKGIKWNPADDRIEYGELLIGEHSPDGTWKHSGQLFSISK
jgi:hypothetical protein